MAIAIATAAVVGACGGQNDDPDGARAIWNGVHTNEGFRAWKRAPGYPNRRPSFTAHSDEVEIFVNDVMAATLEDHAPAPVTEWPVGSVIVKEGFHDGRRSFVAAMAKRTDGWFWAEYEDDGEVLYSGRPGVCVDCHDARKSYSDWVYAFELPR